MPGLEADDGSEDGAHSPVVVECDSPVLGYSQEPPHVLVPSTEPPRFALSSRLASLVRWLRSVETTCVLHLFWESDATRAFKKPAVGRA